ncbi:MAG TPA: laminin B domain-containing protein [Planctomycetota bacterium]|nr:laminin B domain-containing protein [Planctomycetota bacterium]
MFPSSMKRESLRIPVLCALLSITATAQSVPVVESRFDTGTTEGWTALAAAAFNGSPTGGNPGGYLYVDNSEGQVCYIRAPGAFLGDLRGYVGGTLSFDGKMIGTGGSPWTNPLDYGHVFLSNGSTQVVADLAPNQPLTTAYTTYSMPLLPANWGVSAAAFDALLANVTELRISVEALYGAEIQAIDNVVLAPAGTPAAVAPFAAGCASSGGSNTLVAMTMPVIGTTFQAAATGLPGTAFAVAVFGLQPLVPALPLSVVFPQGLHGCDLHVAPDLLDASFVTTGTTQTQLALPNAPGIVGMHFYHQVVPIEVDAALHFVAVTSTNALVMTIGDY